VREHVRFATRILILLALLSIACASVAGQSSSKASRGFDGIAKHLKTRYQAKKKSIPFLGLAKLAVRIVRPAGVKSFSLSLFEGLKDTRELPDNELNDIMRSYLAPEWQPMVSVRSRKGDQVYVYAMEEGKDVKLAVLVINEREAALARVKVSPESLRKFIDDPKILGISLKDNRPEEARR
jgi:hypothetical protein